VNSILQTARWHKKYSSCVIEKAADELPILDSLYTFSWHQLELIQSPALVRVGRYFDVHWLRGRATFFTDQIDPPLLSSVRELGSLCWCFTI
jgi:hypothetical protein